MSFIHVKSYKDKVYFELEKKNEGFILYELNSKNRKFNLRIFETLKIFTK